MIKHLRLYTRNFGFFLAAPTDANPGAGASPKQTLDEKLTAALADLGTARSELATVQKTASDAATTIADLTRERDTLTGQFNAATAEATKAKNDLTASQAQVGTLTTDLATTKATLTKAEANVGRLETLCGVMGVDASAAVPAVVSGAGDHVLDKWMNETDPTAKATIYRAHKADIRAEANRRATAKR